MCTSSNTIAEDGGDGAPEGTFSIGNVGEDMLVIREH
jgi:hypothetical protein